MTDGNGISAGVMDHLDELRARLIRSVIYLVFGVIAAWCFYPQLLALLTHPMSNTLQEMGSKFLYISFPEAFMVQMQVCLVAGLMVASPFITCELWGFIAPGLKPSEKRPLKWIAPLGMLLFFSGITVCYLILPAAFQWFASYIPKNAELRPSMQASVLFTVKMLLVFGIVFELPVVLMLLGRLGIVSSQMLKENWRVAMVLVSIVAAVATPSNDAFSMLMMAIPVAGLYFISILLVKLAESDATPRGWLARVIHRRRQGRGQ